MIEMGMSQKKPFHILLICQAKGEIDKIANVNEPNVMTPLLRYDIHIRGEEISDYFFNLNHLIHSCKNVAHCLKCAQHLTRQLLSALFIKEDNKR